MLYSFHRRTESEICFEKMLKVSYIRNSGLKHPVSYKHKENKRNCKFFSLIGFIITKNEKLKYPKIFAQNWHLIEKLYNFLKNQFA